MRQVIVMPINVAPGREREFEDLIAERAKRHQETPGFERMYLLRTVDPNRFRLVTWWMQIDDPHAWVRKEVYALSENPRHAGIVVGAVPHEVLQVARQFEPKASPVAVPEQRLTPKAVSRAP